ncbi:hypothetical protein OPU71_06200 [Niveibacterium sp. 24ML]|uniref:hypothetical protein n=1 Tax=Niveibacterium sp. 24ML TaxID=2985512 RepID=UPI0022710E04|nr:hypothetical protein [Niveibacterium sp. 24ML]MCX9155715.1 hypothetical protein [Niveibacterium sp. 24ML]
MDSQSTPLAPDPELLAAEALYFEGRLDEAITCLEAAADRAQGAGDLRGAARRAARRGRYLGVRNRNVDALLGMVGAAVLAHRSADPVAMAELRQAMGLVLAILGLKPLARAANAAAIRDFAAQGDTEAVLRSRLDFSFVLGMCGEFEACCELAEPLLAEFVSRGDLIPAIATANNHASALVELGRFDAAQDLLAPWIAHDAVPSHHKLRCYETLLTVALAARQFDEARFVAGVLARGAAETRPDLAHRSARFFQARIAWAEGDGRRALELLRDVLQDPATLRQDWLQKASDLLIDIARDQQDLMLQAQGYRHLMALSDNRAQADRRVTEALIRRDCAWAFDPARASATALPDAPAVSEVWLTYHRGGDPQRAFALAEAARADALAAGERIIAARLLGLMARLGGLLGRGEAALGWAVQAVCEAADLPDLRLEMELRRSLAVCLGSLGLIDAGLAVLACAAHNSEALGGEGGHWIALDQLFLLASGGRHAAACELAGPLTGQLAAAGEWVPALLAANNHACSLSELGRNDEAGALLQTWLARSEVPESRKARARDSLIDVLLANAQYDEVDALLEAAERESNPERGLLGPLGITLHRGRLAWLRGDSAQALQSLRSVIDNPAALREDWLRKASTVLIAIASETNDYALQDAAWQRLIGINRARAERDRRITALILRQQFAWVFEDADALSG